MKGQRLQVVDKFTYHGSTLSRIVHIDDEVNARIAKVSAAFGPLRGSIWDQSGIRLDTKLKVYRSVVLPTLLYACETFLRGGGGGGGGGGAAVCNCGTPWAFLLPFLDSLPKD